MVPSDQKLDTSQIYRREWDEYSFWQVSGKKTEMSEK
jgi:hypothetical protein